MCELDPFLLQEYIDGSIGPVEKIVLEEHLRQCSNCRKELNHLKIMEWDMKNFYQEIIDIPSELANLRNQVLEECARKESESTLAKEGAITLRDVVSLQASNFSNTFMFLNLLPGLIRKNETKTKEQKKRKLESKKNYLMKIIGL